MSTPLIQFKDVTKRFETRTILNKVNLEIYEGHITTIIGKSGTGKSVLLKHIMGLLSPEEGSILFQGKDIHKMNKKEQDNYVGHISYMFQNNALFDSMSVFDNIALPLRQTTNLSKKEIEERVKNRIEQTELTEVTYKYPSEISGGMQKRAALARALVTDPQIVLFDEPTTGQDPIRKNAILSMIAQYKRKFGFTAVVISHDIPDIFFISDRIILLWEGKIGFQGTYEEAIKLHHPMVDEFLYSLEGFQDELTGLLSKQTFRARYETALNPKRKEKKVTAVLFSLQLELLTEVVGHTAALEVVKSLGEFINTHLDALGGFSSRQSREWILTLLPHADIDETREMVDDFGKDLQEEWMHRIYSWLSPEGCLDFSIFAGIVEVKSGEDIDLIIKKAMENQKEIASMECKLRI